MRIHVHIVAQPRLVDDRASVRWIDEILERVDGYGIERISTGDVVGNHLECFAALGYMAARTRRVRVGPFITTAAHREVGLLAAAAASLDAISDGRAYLVLGRGDGVVRNLGLRPQSVDQLRDSIATVRTLLSGETHRHGGVSLTLPWPDRPASRLPIYAAAGGPRMVRMAAETADGVYLAMGCTDACIARARREIEAVERDAPFDIWWVTRFGIADTTDEALAIASEGLSSVGNHALRGSDYGSRDVPVELWPALREYHERYDYARKNPLDTRGGSSPSNVELMNELGLRDYFMERFGIAGTPDEVVARLEDLARRGVDSVTLLASNLRELDLIGERVLPRLLAREPIPR